MQAKAGSQMIQGIYGSGTAQPGLMPELSLGHLALVAQSGGRNTNLMPIIRRSHPRKIKMYFCIRTLVNIGNFSTVHGLILEH
jgi:hypothetical protein